MTPEQLDEIEARAGRATEGPWVVHQGMLMANSAFGLMPVVNNAEFIAAARADVPQLVAEVRRLRAQIEAVKELHKPIAYEGGFIYCDHCFELTASSCPTIQALGEADE